MAHSCVRATCVARRVCGITLLEVLTAVVILGILGFVGYISYRPLLARAEAAQCMTNMRSLHTALVGYMQDKAQWPQPPEGLWEAEDQGPFEDWWIATLTPYGGTEVAWQCPTLRRLSLTQPEEEQHRMHYEPTPFDERTMTPYRWATQPWLVEIGDIHGRGAHILFPDGSIRVMDDIVPPRR